MATPDPSRLNRKKAANSAYTILVVDDDPDVLRATARLVQAEGYKVLMGASAAEALALTRQYRPDLLLLDVVMGDGSGLDVARQVKTDLSLGGVFVVLVSGSRITPENQAEGLDAGLADGYIIRPFNKHEFIARVESSIRLRAAQVALREKSAELERIKKDESLGRMAGAIAHHFNNQLMAVMGNLELAMAGLPTGTKPMALLHEAMSAARQAVTVSGQMMTYLGYASGDFAVLDISGVCRESLILLQTAKPGNVTVQAELPSQGPSVRANAGQIQGVLINLVTNAWESMGAGLGVIVIAVKTVSGDKIPALHRFPVDWQPQGVDYACLEVRDTGCGIAPQEIEKIFDPYFSTKLLGRGMGLAEVVGIVRSHGGGVTVASAPGQGSVFDVFLPVAG